MTQVEKELAQAPRSQVERLAFIEARLYFLGELQRQDVAERFAVASAQASRDLSLYKQLAPKNLDYDYRERTYQPSTQFKRIFQLSTENVLWWLKSGVGDGLPNPPGLPVASRMIVGPLDKQIRMHSVPVLHGLNRRSGLQR